MLRKNERRTPDVAEAHRGRALLLQAELRGDGRKDPQNQIRGLLSLTGCDDHQARVFLQRIQPVRQISRAVVDGSILDAAVPREKCGAHLGNEFLAAVVVVSEALEVRQA